MHSRCFSDRNGRLGSIADTYLDKNFGRRFRRLADRHGARKVFIHAAGSCAGRRRQFRCRAGGIHRRVQPFGLSGRRSCGSAHPIRTGRDPDAEDLPGRITGLPRGQRAGFRLRLARFLALCGRYRGCRDHDRRTYHRDPPCPSGSAGPGHGHLLYRSGDRDITVRNARTCTPGSRPGGGLDWDRVARRRCRRCRFLGIRGRPSIATPDFAKS